METRDENRTTIFRLMQDVGLGCDTEICQYMKLDYLLNLLKSKKYYVNTKKCFIDKSEKKIPRKMQFMEFTRAGEQLTPSQKKKCQERSASISRYEKEYSCLLTSCWTERISENALMWDRMGGNYQACIKTTIGNFVKAFPNLEYNIWCGKMLYGPIFPVLMPEDIIWYKEQYFSDEREIRFYFSKELDQIQPDGDDKEDHKLMPVNIKTLIGEIILSPYIKKEVAEQIKEYISKTYGIKRTSLSKIEIK